MQWDSGTCCLGLRVDGKRLREADGTRMGALMGLIEKHVAGDLVGAYSIPKWVDRRSYNLQSDILCRVVLRVLTISMHLRVHCSEERVSQ